MTTRPKGTVVVDEIILPIVDITLEDGTIRFHVRAQGPLPEIDTDDYLILGRDGREIARSRTQVSAGRFRCPAVDPYSVLVATVGITMMEVDSLASQR